MADSELKRVMYCEELVDDYEFVTHKGGQYYKTREGYEFFPDNLGDSNKKNAKRDVEKEMAVMAALIQEIDYLPTHPMASIWIRHGNYTNPGYSVRLLDSDAEDVWLNWLDSNGYFQNGRRTCSSKGMEEIRNYKNPNSDISITLTKDIL